MNLVANHAPSARQAQKAAFEGNKLAKRLRTSARSIKARLAREGVLDPDSDS